MEMEERRRMAAAAGPPPLLQNGGAEDGGSGGSSSCSLFQSSLAIPPLWRIPGMVPFSPDLAMQHHKQKQKQQQQQQMLQHEEQIFSSNGPAAARNDVAEEQRQEPMRDEAHRCYPAPLVLHQDVIADTRLFLRTLAEFHLVFGSQLAIPRVSLDLHGLYCKVTSYGGLEQVVRHNLWKQVASALELPQIVSCPSYFLRKHYVSLLHHYEQVYFQRVQGQPVEPPVPLPMPLNTCSSKPEILSAKKRGREKFDQVQANGVGPAVPLGQTVTGAIDGKFEHGYFVTVVVGSEKLRGVIYNVPPSQLETEQFSEVTELMNSVGKTDLRSSLRSTRKKKKKRDPDAPRPARTAYSFFVAEQKRKQKSGKEEVGKKVWNALPLQEKLPYLQLAEQDQERYQREVLERQQQQQGHADFRPREDAEAYENGYRVQPSFLEPSSLPHELSYSMSYDEVEQQQQQQQQHLAHSYSSSSQDYEQQQDVFSRRGYG